MPVPVLTPAGPLAKRGLQSQAFTATNGVDSWVASGGTLSGTGAAAATWTAPNVTGIYTVTATNASGSTIVTITVIAVFLWVPSYTYPVKRKKKVLLFQPESGPRQTITKQGKKLTFEVGANNRPAAERAAVEAFWDAHYPNKQFYFSHPNTAVEGTYVIDSDMNEEWSRVALTAWSMVLQEA